MELHHLLCVLKFLKILRKLTSYYTLKIYPKDVHLKYLHSIRSCIYRVCVFTCYMLRYDSEMEGQLYAKEDIKTEIPFGKIVLTDETRQLNNRIIDCVFSKNVWKYTELRRDRDYPDHIDTVKGK